MHCHQAQQRGEGVRASEVGEGGHGHPEVWAPREEGRSQLMLLKAGPEKKTEVVTEARPLRCSNLATHK